MKSLNETELSELVQWMKPQVEGARLQDIGVDGDGLWLELYRQGLCQIHLDLKPGRGFMVLWSGEDLPRRKNSMRPLALFLNSHAKNLELIELRMKPEYGRVVELLFSSSDGLKKCRLEVVLIPQALNAFAESEGKKLAWVKPKPMEKQSGGSVFPVRYSDWRDYQKDYALFRGQGTGPQSKTDSDPASDLEALRLKQWKKDFEKKTSIVAKLRESLASTEFEEWQAFGEELKMGQDLSHHEKWDARLSLSENREKAFRKSKDLRAKKGGTEERIGELEAELVQIQAWIENPKSAPEHRTQKGRGSQVLAKTESKGRTLNLPSGLQAIVGRSAQDNLAILRRARGWDLWVHMKDEPSAHAIIFRDKNQNVSREDIEAVALWIQRSGSGKKIQLEGLRFEVVVVECRFVRPIKGDKHGRVNYHTPTVYSFASKSSPS